MNTELLRNCRAELEGRIARASAAIASLDLVLGQDAATVTPEAPPTAPLPSRRSGGRAAAPQRGRKSRPLQEGGLADVIERAWLNLPTTFTSVELRAMIRKIDPEFDSKKLCNMSGYLRRAVKANRLLEKNGIYKRLKAQAAALRSTKEAIGTVGEVTPARPRKPAPEPQAADIEEAVRLSMPVMATPFRLYELMAHLEEHHAGMFRHAEPGAIRDELNLMVSEGLLAEVSAADGKPMWRKTGKP